MEPLNRNDLNKILIVGFGSMGKKYAQIIRKHFPEITIGILSSQKIHNLKANYATNDEDIIWFESIDEAIDFSPDAAIFSNPASMHIESAFPFANEGVNLLIEKPISTTYKRAKELVSLCEEKNIILMTGYNLRYLPSLIHFRSLLIDGRIGDIYSVNCEAGSFLPNWRQGADYRQTVSAQESLGGGVLFELSHELDYIQWIFGNITWIIARSSKQSKLEIDVEDTCNMILGIQGTTDNNELIASVNLDFIRHNATRTCLAIGSKGSLSWCGIKGVIKYFPMNGNSWEIIYSKTEDLFSTYIEEVRYFFDSIVSNTQPLVDGREGLKTLGIIKAAKESSKSGKIIIPSDDN